MASGWMRSLLLVTAACLAAACSQSESTPSDTANEAGFTVYLVRHAEKTADDDDPALTPDGEVRAGQLADLLQDEGIETIWSTDYRRTMSTAQPLADQLDLVIQTYDPGDLPGFATTIEAAGETALIVGHSNTTPQLSAALGGAPGEEINEAAEYDRLYVLSGVGTGQVATEIRRFGAAYDAASD